jgi:uncharacterized flavoprotein (TIGR03862 family)
MTANPETPKQIAIIGGGPAGLIAAETLANLGYGVTLFDAMPSIGRKFLLAGRGGLNITHNEALPTFVTRYGDGSDWMAELIAGFTPDQLRAWAEGLGQELFVGSSGRVFPKAMKASPLLRAWIGRLTALGVQIRRGTRWLGWEANGALKLQQSDSSQITYKADATLLALGGASWAKLGSDGAWVDVLAQQGVAMAPLVASNCGVLVDWSDHFRNRFAGTPLKGVAVTCGSQMARGDVMITSTGLEGGPIYALSPDIRGALSGEMATLTLDLRPDTDIRTLAEKLVKARDGKSISTALKSQARLAPAAIGLMREASGNVLPTTAMGLARLIKAVTLPMTGLAPIDRAISTAGGVKREALTESLMLRALPGVFMAGEMLDWDAPTGGYLLQACFASGKHAALGIDAYLNTSIQD